MVGNGEYVDVLLNNGSFFCFPFLFLTAATSPPVGNGALILIFLRGGSVDEGAVVVVVVTDDAGTPLLFTTVAGTVLAVLVGSVIFVSLFTTGKVFDFSCVFLMALLWRTLQKNEDKKR